jgi:hypothetical protein
LVSTVWAIERRMTGEGLKVAMNSDGQHASHGQRNMGNRALFPVPIRGRLLHQVSVLDVAFAVATCALIGVVPAAAQPEVIRCLSPEAPMTELPVDVLAEYRTEIAAEFEAYFSSVSEHIACLDEERARILDEARAATEAYTRLINTIPVRKDLP